MPPIKKLFRVSFLILATALLCLSGRSQLAPMAQPVQLYLWWNYPIIGYSTNLWFNFYSTTNLSVPPSNWTFYASYAATNPPVATNLPGEALYRMPAQPGPQAQYFTMSASNMTGQTTFMPGTNWAELDPLLESIANLTIAP